MKGYLVAFGIFAAAMCGVVALAALFFLNDREPPEPPWHVLSSAISPDNTYVAENDLEDSENGGGRISVRRLNGPEVYEVRFTEPQPSVFLRWIDGSHLLVLSELRLAPMAGPRKEGAPEVSYTTYVRLGAAIASVTAKAHVALALEATDVTATFGEKTYSDPPIKKCSLNLSAKDGKKFDDIGMILDAGVYPCFGRLCGGIRSQFKVGEQVDHEEYHLLTSATVGLLQSFNVLPEGAGFRSIRGQFNERTAMPLIEELKGPYFDIDYNFDFDEQNIRYTIPTSAVSGPISEFIKCVGSPIFY